MDINLRFYPLVHLLRKLRQLFASKDEEIPNTNGRILKQISNMARQQSSIIARVPKKPATSHQANSPANNQSTQNGAATDKVVEIKGTWAPLTPSTRRDYALAFVDVEVKVVGESENTESQNQ